MNAIQNELIANVSRHLLQAQEELLGLHREGGLTYEQYSQVANLERCTEGLSRDTLKT